MKFLTIFLFAALIILASACESESENREFVNHQTLTGKWILTETYRNPGSGNEFWIAVPKNKNYDYIQFEENNKFRGTVYSDFSTYTIKNSATLTLKRYDNSEQNYSVKFENGVLTLYPAGPLYCIEGCGDRFRKVK